MKIIKRVIATILLIALMTTTVYSVSTSERIDVIKNLVRLEVNGNYIETDNFVYEETTYVPIRAAAEMLGAEVTWDGNTSTAGIITADGSSSSNIEKLSISPYLPTFSLADLGLVESDVDLAVIREDGEVLSTSWVVTNDTIEFFSAGVDYGQPTLSLLSDYTLNVYKKNGTKVIAEFSTTGLNNDISFGDDYQVFYIPAMPEQGFNWPYFLVLPPNDYANDNNNNNSKNYLMVEGINNGGDSSYSTYINKLGSLNTDLQIGRSNGLDMARQLTMPYLMPLIPRPDVGYRYNNDSNWLYTHALDRDTAILDQLLELPDIGDQLTSSFEDIGFDPDDFSGLTDQVVHMVEHCIAYLNDQDFELEDKIMMYGYSAQGTFDDRFTMLYPELVKAYASGATSDDLILPLATYEGDDLIFPIGVSDYEDITGNTFDMDAHNEVARLIFMGKDDTNDVTKYSDCYSSMERELIYEHWGTDMLQRAISLTNLYGESGGHGIFILDVGEGHGMSRDMDDYLVDFYVANRDSETPVYPVPSNPNQLEYTIFE